MSHLMLQNGTLTSCPQINLQLLLHNSPKNKIKKVLQHFSGSLLPNILLDKVSYECGLLEGQFVTGLESKFHTPTQNLNLTFLEIEQSL